MEERERHDVAHAHGGMCVISHLEIIPIITPQATTHTHKPHDPNTLHTHTHRGLGLPLFFFFLENSGLTLVALGHWQRITWE